MNTNKIAYLINQYPKVSHTFIRREILALEALGLQINRLSVRGWDNPVADPIDETVPLRDIDLLDSAPRAILEITADHAWLAEERRGDATVPELSIAQIREQMTLAINRDGRIFGYTIGNDMSSRDIEGENPLYLPQAAGLILGTKPLIAGCRRLSCADC
mgnify:CR=1 FL=1